jgi:sRNA-binding regulator protein Hfq
MQKSIQTRLFEGKKGKKITFFLLNGKEVKGILRGHEQYTITIENENGLVETYYKHAVIKVCWGKVQFNNKQNNNKSKQEEVKEEA